MNTPETNTRPFVGRTAQLQALSAHLAMARAGDGRLVLVSGEPGIGKTRLIEEAVVDLARDRVLWGRCHETAGAPAFWPWIQVLRAYVRATPPERLRDDLGDMGPELARLVPAIRRLCPDLDDREPASADPEEARFRLFDAVAIFLRNIATAQDLVIVLDDLHWADSESLLLLAFVAREQRGLRLLLLGTYRPAEMELAASAPQVLGDLSRASHSLPLDGLTVEDVGSYVAATRGSSSTPDTIAEIHRVTEGNAFFLTELVQVLNTESSGDAALPVERLEIPSGIRQVVRRRVEPLSAVGRRLLTAAAVLGREFTVGVLAGVVKLEPKTIFAELGTAVRLGAIDEVSERPGHFRFAHALLVDALVADLDPGVRAELHKASAATLEEVHAANVEPVLGEIAHHYFNAAPLGTLPKAIEYSVRAGQQAYLRLGYEEAAKHFQRALAVSRDASVEPVTRLAILFPLGWAQEVSGDNEAARATMIEAAALARDLGDTPSFAFAAAVAAASGAETGTVDWTLVRLLEQAVKQVGVDDSRRRPFLLSQLSRALYFADVERRHTVSEEALEIARRGGNRAILLGALQARQLALWEPGEAVRRREIGAEALAVAHRSKLILRTAESLAWQILDHLELGDMAVVQRAFRDYREMAAKFRLPRIRWHATVVEATLAQLAGRLADADRLARHAATLLQPSRLNNVTAFQGVQLFSVYEEQGRLAELEPMIANTAERSVNLPIWRAGLALLHAHLGRVEAAREVLAGLGAAHFTDLPFDGNLLGTYARVAETCALVGAADLAEPLSSLLAPHVSSVVVLGITAGCLGSAARFAGLVAHLLGRLDEAIQHFEAALATNQRIGALPQQAHTQRELAITLRARGARGDHERAADLVAAAAKVATRLQLVSLQRRLEKDGLEGSSALATRAAPSAANRPQRARLLRDGDVWTITSGQELSRLNDTKGLTYLAELLRHPGQELHALDLGGAADFRPGDAGEVLDADARRAYKARIAELDAELDEAESHHDIGRAARAREELEILAAELSRATGLRGRVRKAGSDAERARLNVTRAVRKVVRKIVVECPILGRHLDRSVNTGLFCSYEPDPSFPIEWQL